MKNAILILFFLGVILDIFAQNLPIKHHNFNSSSQHSGIIDLNNLRADTKGILELSHESNLREYSNNPVYFSGMYKHQFIGNRSFQPFAGLVFSKYEIGAFSNNGVQLSLGTQYKSDKTMIALGLGVGQYWNDVSTTSLSSADYEDFGDLKQDNSSTFSINPTVQAGYIVNHRLSLISTYALHHSQSKDLDEAFYDDQIHYFSLGASIDFKNVKIQSSLNIKNDDFNDSHYVWLNRMLITELVGIGVGIGKDHFFSYELRMKINQLEKYHIYLSYNNADYNGGLVRKSNTQQLSLQLYFN